MMPCIMTSMAADLAAGVDQDRGQGRVDLVRTGGVALRLAGVQRHFAGLPVLQDIDLQVPRGQFLALLGPSGCGKSTLLRLVAGLDAADEGSVRVDGRLVDRVGRGRRRYRDPEDGAGRAPELAFVFQAAHLLPWRTLVRNVELPLELRGVGRHERRARAMALIEQVGLADAAGRYPGELSGGMQMRASLARALVTEPALLLLDEPFAALDEITRQRLDGQLYDLWRQRGMTVLFVTHSIGEAVFLAQRAIMLSARPARMVADRAIELPGPRTPAVRDTAEFGELVRALHQDLIAAEGAGG